MNAIRIGFLSSVLFLVMAGMQLYLPETANGFLIPVAHAQNCEYPPVDEPDGDGDECDPTYLNDLNTTKANGDQSDDTNSCPMTCGNPINFATGDKFQKEVDYVGFGPFPLTLIRYYNSQDIGNYQFGSNWRSSYSRSISLQSSSVANAIRDDGKLLTFTLINGVWTPDSDVNSKLVKTANGWTYTTGRDETETYDGNGKLLSIANRAGALQTLTYDNNGNLSIVQDPVGYQLKFYYTQISNGWRVYQVVAPDGTHYYSYGANNNLIQANQVDGSHRQYLYENSSFLHALTGITDENGQRFATWAYDSAGRATSSQHAGGADLYTVDYTYISLGYVTVTTPLGATYAYALETINGVPHPYSVVRTCNNCTSGGSATLSPQYDANGNISRKTDYNGNVTTYTYDLTRNLETSRTEASGTPQARTITTQWHPTFRLPTQITEPNRVTTFSYDSHGNLLQKTVTAGSLTRTWTYTYNANGQVLSVDGPRTDVSDITTFTYDSKGNVSTITNALGQVTRITSYDGKGHPLSIQDPNGVVTSLSYDVAGRLTNRNSGGESTRFTYDSIGELTQITLPDSSWVIDSYDAAHRLTGMQDAHSNTVSYTLDAAGNRTQEKALAGGTQTQIRSHVYDGLSRLAQDIGALNQTTSYGYDNNGNRTSVTDPLSHTTLTYYDALNRVIQVTDPNSQATTYTYDANDNLTGVSDPRSLATGYTYDGLGDQTTQNSPDTGTTTRTFDAAGNVATATDARGDTTTYSYDALNRLTSASFADGKVTTYQYDQGTNGIGHLTTMTDASGTTTWSYDSHGRVLTKQQLADGVMLTTSMTYNAGGNLSNLTYPSGRRVNLSYSLDHVNQLSTGGATIVNSIAYQPLGMVSSWVAGNGRPYSRSFDQDGRIASFGVASGTPFTATLSYDAASRVTGITDSVLPSKTFGYDNLDRLTSYQTNTVSQSYTYDGDGNRLSLTSGGTTSYSYASISNQLLNTTGAVAQTFGYDAAGNVTANNTATTNYSYIYDASNRMVTANTGTNSTTYTLNGLGQRVTKSGYGARLIAGGAEIYVYDGAGHLLGEYDASGHVIQETAWLGNLPIAMMMSSQVYYIYPDHLGAPRAIASNGTTLVWTWDHDPFGNGQPTGSITYNVRFPGQYFDNEANLNYNYSRDYNPGTGRYQESDQLGLIGGINTYNYVAANPASGTDPLGLDTQITIGFTHTPVPRYYHEVVILTDTVTGQQYATRAGPATQTFLGSGSASSESSSGGSLSASDGYGGSGGFGFGTIVAQSGPFGPTFRDPPSSVVYTQDVGTIPLDFSQAVADANNFVSVTNSNTIPYWVTGLNSNSYASTFVTSLTGSRPQPDLRAPGWDQGVPDPRLSYQPSQLINACKAK